MIEFKGLTLVATPIGNRGDISSRAISCLKNADLIMAEDTRHSRKILDAYEIKTPTVSYNDFNKERKSKDAINRLLEGQNIALISDAGTPGIADPGFYILREAKRNNIPVSAVPGPCAFITALVISGMPTDHFYFGNFPPKKSSQRLIQLNQYKETFTPDYKWCPTLGFYIGPKQLIKFLGEINQVFGEEIRIVLVRELTKIYEEILDKPCRDHLEYYTSKGPKGEYVLFFHPQNKGMIIES